MKLGRNHPCWCGSGKKYKKCHLHRDTQPKIEASEALNFSKKSQNSGSCNCPDIMKPDCSGKPINSHSISKSLGLNTIAESGHILALKHDISTLTKNHGRAILGQLGVNKTSIFPGFCARHDKELFAPIEDATFSGSPEQCGLLSYRAMARERHTKVSGIRVNDFLKGSDKGRSLPEQMLIQRVLADYGLGLGLANQDIDRALAVHHEAVTNGNYTAFESAIFEFTQDFPLLCSTGHMPSDDWNGKIIQDLLDENLEAAWVTAVAFHSVDRAWVIFTWLRGTSEVEKFVASLSESFSGSEADALIKYFFSISENIAVDPKWWRSLGDVERQALEARIMDGVPTGGVLATMAPRKSEPIVSSLKLLSQRRV